MAVAQRLARDATHADQDDAGARLAPDAAVRSDEFRFAVWKAKKLSVGHDHFMKPISRCARRDQRDTAAWMGEELAQPWHLATTTAERRIEPNQPLPRLAQTVVDRREDPPRRDGTVRGAPAWMRWVRVEHDMECVEDRPRRVPIRRLANGEFMLSHRSLLKGGRALARGATAATQPRLLRSAPMIGSIISSQMKGAPTARAASMRS